MADAVLGLLLENLSSLLRSEFGLLHGVKEEVEKLSLKLSTVRAVIEDAETRQYTDKAIAVWLRRLKDAAYDAEDVLDEWLTEVRSSDLETTQVTQSLASLFHFNQPVFRHKIAKKIKKVHADFDSIAEEMSKFHLKTRVVERGALLDPNRETSSLLVEPEQIYGRDEDRKKIVDILISDVSSPNVVTVLPIVGVGGIGKTTLAQFIYNDERVSKYFKARMWVCVAEDFDVKRLTTSIITCLSGKACDLKELDPLQNHLKELLTGKRFLLVLDDVWDDDYDTWGKLKQSLTCGAKGSSILITTRLETVASIMGTVPMYNLSFLSDVECWTLFKARACCMNDEDLSANLAEIGKQIVKKCGGIPLVVNVLGALLRYKRNVHEWESIRESEIWELPEDKGGAILGVLRLSYDHLPFEAKQCFSYCSLYPKDHELRITELIQLWMANGFFHSNGKMELEDRGNDIFKELLRGSFFQEPVKDYSGNIVTCKMHDLMHDLACSITKNECCVVKDENIDNVPESVRHLSLIGTPRNQLSFKSLRKLNKRLRTLVVSCEYNALEAQQIQIIFSKFKYLRVLKLEGADIRQVPNSIGCMKCLRYLNLSYNIFLGLPKSICSLINLQSLILKNCYSLTRLPKHLRKMRSLRHLDVGGCEKLSTMPIKMGEMTGLRTLSMFAVSKRKGRQINELNGLKNLSGKLELTGLGVVNDSKDAEEADLGNKPNLSSLLLSWDLGNKSYLSSFLLSWELRNEPNLSSSLSSFELGFMLGLLPSLLFSCESVSDFQAEEEEVMKKSERVLECLQPHLNLNQKFTIESYPGVVLPSWMSLLRNLREIQLLECRNCETLPPLGQLPLLQVLKIVGMTSLKCIGVEFYGEVVGHLKGFPSLENLQLKEMDNLEKWEFLPLLLNDALFPCLSKLDLSKCPKLETPSFFVPTNCCLRNLKSLYDRWCFFLYPIPSQSYCFGNFDILWEGVYTICRN